ncbi:unnamed protein product, partial [marine sediment metagenome]
MNRSGKLVNFPGITNAQPGVDVFGFYEDFIGKDIATHQIPGWVATKTGGDFGVDSAVTLLSEIGGGIKLAVLGTTDNDGINFCMDGGAFTPTAGTSIFFETKLRIDGCDSTPEINFIAGLCAPSQTAMLAANGGLANVRNAIFACSADGFAQLDANSTSAAVADERETSVGVLVDDTFITLGIVFEGAGKLKFLIDGKIVHTTTTAASIPIGTLTPIFG